MNDEAIWHRNDVPSCPGFKYVRQSIKIRNARISKTQHIDPVKKGRSSAAPEKLNLSFKQKVPAGVSQWRVAIPTLGDGKVTIRSGFLAIGVMTVAGG